jgi:UDP-glucuronate 4-epimerase
MTILVTGAAGFIGSTLADALLARGETVVAIDDFNDYYDPARKRANVAGIRGHARAHLYEMDIRDAAGIARVFAEHRPRAVAHLGAYGGVRYSIGRAPLYAEVNFLGTVNLLEAARHNGVEVFVFASTSSVYGNTTALPFLETDPCNLPLAPYPATKKAAEVMGHTYHNLHGLNFTALRFFSVYGPRGRPDMMPFMVTDRIVRGEEITLFEAGRLKRDWTYVDDVVNGILAALARPMGYQLINLGRGEPVLMSDFVARIETLVGKPARLRTPPAPESEPAVTFADIGLARRLLGYDPRTPVEAGLRLLWDWYRREVMR